MSTNKIKSINIVVLLPESFSKIHKVGEGLIKIFSPKKVNLYFHNLDKIIDKDLINVRNFFSNLIYDCLQADIIILNNWLPNLPIKYFYTHNKNAVYLTEILSAKKTTFRGQLEMRSLAEHLKQITTAKIYSLALGLSTFSPVNDYAELIFSFHDQIILQNYIQQKTA